MLILPGGILLAGSMHLFMLIASVIFEIIQDIDCCNSSRNIDFWPDCVVRYTIHENYYDNTKMVQLLAKVFSIIEDRTMIRFVVCRGEPHCIAFITSTKLLLQFGYNTEAENTTNVYAFGQSEYSVFKVVLRTLGILELANRSDRDKYIIVDEGMIASKRECREFYKRIHLYPSIPFKWSFDTVMFHDVTFCARCKQCMVVKPLDSPKQTLDTFRYKYAREHRDYVTRDEYLSEISRLQIIYSVQKCLPASLSAAKI